MSVSRKRHVAKALTWRVIASCTTLSLGWAFTGDMKTGLAIGAFDFVLKLALYYGHERAWYRWSRFGLRHGTSAQDEARLGPIEIHEPHRPVPISRASAPAA